MPEYIGLPIEVDTEDLKQLAFDYLQAKVPGWNPNAPNLDVWLLEAASLWAADLRTSLSEQANTLFRYFGSSLMGIQPVLSSPSSVVVTIAANDNQGYTMPAGTIVGFTTSAGDLLTFATATTLQIATGSASGTVTLVATENGTASNGLGGAGVLMQMVDPLDWVSTVTMAGITTGGADAESDDDYLARLSAQLQMMTPRPILPADFSGLALNIAGVARALAIDGYDPVALTFNNARMVAIAAVDQNGNPVGSSVKAAIQQYLDGLREVNFIVNVMDPTITPVDVTFNVKVLPGQTASAVAANIVTALQQYLSTVGWGVSQSSLGNWYAQSNVRVYELATIINQVDGVDYIITLTIGVNNGAQDSIDIILPGAAPLATPGTITGSAS